MEAATGESPPAGCWADTAPTRLPGRGRQTLKAVAAPRISTSPAGRTVTASCWQRSTAPARSRPAQATSTPSPFGTRAPRGRCSWPSAPPPGRPAPTTTWPSRPSSRCRRGGTRRVDNSGMPTGTTNLSIGMGLTGSRRCHVRRLRRLPDEITTPPATRKDNADGISTEWASQRHRNQESHSRSTRRTRKRSASPSSDVDTGGRR